MLRNPLSIVEGNILEELLFKRHKTIIHKRVGIMEKFRDKTNRIVNVKNFIRQFMSLNDIS